MEGVRERLLEEVKRLERELKIELPKEIKAALSMGDLRENAEYHAALERQAFVRARIGQLQTRLTELGSFSIDHVPKDRVGIGSKVTLLDVDLEQEITYELVFPELADHANGLISVASPIGKGLIGRKDGDVVTIRIPSGEKKFEILEFRSLHEKD
jgi:transcription elongation factor GreA